mgnify:CR=1 FL=1
MALTATTKLEAVNLMLSTIGEAPVNSLTSGLVDAELAETILASVSKAVQSEGWNFNTEKNLVDVKPGKVYKVNFVVENFSKDPTSGVASYNVSPSSFGPYFNKLGCFCFEKQTLNPGEKKSYFMTFYLDPEVVNDPKTKNVSDVTLSYTFFSSDYYKQTKLIK